MQPDENQRLIVQSDDRSEKKTASAFFNYRRHVQDLVWRPQVIHATGLLVFKNQRPLYFPESICSPRWPSFLSSDLGLYIAYNFGWKREGAHNPQLSCALFFLQNISIFRAGILQTDAPRYSSEVLENGELASATKFELDVSLERGAFRQMGSGGRLFFDCV